MGSILVLFLLSLLAGCGGGNVVEISGIVKYDGQPVPEGRITFLTQDGKGQTVGVIAEGKYSVKVHRIVSRTDRRFQDRRSAAIASQRPFQPEGQCDRTADPRRIQREMQTKRGNPRKHESAQLRPEEAGEWCLKSIRTARSGRSPAEADWSRCRLQRATRPASGSIPADFRPHQDALAGLQFRPEVSSK